MKTAVSVRHETDRVSPLAHWLECCVLLNGQLMKSGPLAGEQKNWGAGDSRERGDSRNAVVIKYDFFSCFKKVFL